jgi:uncharacterized cupin superfamily protein
MAYPNLFHTKLQADPNDPDPEGFRGAALNLTTALAASELIVKLTELEPGNHLCPYHYEYVEEWLVVVSGQVELRTPEGTEPLAGGDVVSFPVGPAGGHRVSVPADATGPARVLMFSADADPAVTVYPDSDKLAVYTRSGEDEVFVRRSEASSHLDYYDGETA